MRSPGGASGRGGWAGRLVRRLRGWRRIRITSAGTLFVAGTLAVGFVAATTGNNLLHLLLGAMLGTTAVSGWVAERNLRHLSVTRRVPRGVPVGQEVVLRYTVRNGKGKTSTFGLELREEGLPGGAFVGRVAPGETVETRSGNTFVRRGVYPLPALTLSTAFPFGFVRRERDVPLPDELVIWPRTDRPVAPPRPGGGGTVGAGADLFRGPGPRGEFRGLREYRWGDDARDIHWRSSARRSSPVMREYDRDTSDTLWICLDVSSPPGEAAEDAVDIAASLAARASAEGRRHALAAGGTVVPPGSGNRQLERVLETLARIDFAADAPPPSPPVDPSACILVATTARGGGWADVRLAVAGAEVGPS